MSGMAGNMTDLVQRVTFGKTTKPEFPEFKSGDTLSVHVRVKEGEKERIQVFKGTVIKVQGSGMGRSFTVRKMSSGVGVERTFPFSSPMISKIEMFSHGFVRRSRLFYLRELRGKAATIRSELAQMRQARDKAKAKENK